MKSILKILLGSTSAVVVKEIAKIIMETKNKKDIQKMEEENRRYVDETAQKILHRVYKDIKDITVVIRVLLVGFLFMGLALIAMIVLFLLKA